MLVGLHTHYQMHLASTFTLFLMKIDSTWAFYLQIQSIFYKKTNTFYKKLPHFIKNYIGHIYKKLQPQISAFIKKTPFLEIIETPADSHIPETKASLEGNGMIICEMRKNFHSFNTFLVQNEALKSWPNFSLVLFGKGPEIEQNATRAVTWCFCDKARQ